MTDRAHELEPPSKLTTEEPPGQSRRDVLDAVLMGGAVLLGGSALYPIVSFVSAPLPPETSAIEVSAGKASDVAPGQAVSFRFGSKPALLVREHGGRLHAFIALCTHLDCVVKFRPDLARIWCACHNGHFDLSGRNVQGPPPRPLVQLAIELRGDEVFVRRA
ncbi:MAG: ubiquinol-cytochrome c reductase iron-sulfur subunit [Deltaproteobacteria bacterium]|nr:ubiquinol-cytochrome c reductase iron-sulfur subunit [Deltaproteobacteria bacterium]